MFWLCLWLVDLPSQPMRGLIFGGKKSKRYYERLFEYLASLLIEDTKRSAIWGSGVKLCNFFVKNLCNAKTQCVNAMHTVIEYKTWNSGGFYWPHEQKIITFFSTSPIVLWILEWKACIIKGHHKPSLAVETLRF